MFFIPEKMLFEGVKQPDLIRDALRDYPEILGVSEIIEGNGVLHTGSRKKSVEINGIRWLDHLQSSGLGGQLIHGSMDEFASDQMGVLLGSRVFTRLNIKMGERISWLAEPELYTSVYVEFLKRALVR